MNKPLKILSIFAVILMGFAAFSHEAEAGSGKCRSYKKPNPKSGSCVGIKNCTHDQSKEDTANANSGIKKVAQCVVSKSGKRMNMVSGYRCSRGSPGCNRGNLPYNGGANCSLHLRGDAIDFNLSGLSLPQVQSYALACGAKAAVKYPCYNFVHMDTGRPRSWRTCGSRNPDKISKIRSIFDKVAGRRG